MGAARKLQVADLFCGAGGTSTGVALACKELDYAVELLAINHWQVAIDTHSKNHPWARHLCANVEAVDPRKVVPGGRLDLLVASPECIWHSTARGGKPVNDQARASAWRVLEWCERLHVSNVLIENVPEFRGWGPLGADDRPLKSKRGAIFHQFVRSLEAMNYRVEYRVLNAADYGAATSRRRLFILARKGNRRIPWPEATHAKDAKDLFGKLKPWRAAREIIDWSIDGQSVFTRKKRLAKTTLLRIRAGLVRYGGALAPIFVSALDAYMAGRPVGEAVELQLSNGTAEAFMAVLRGTSSKQVEGAVRSCDGPVPAMCAGGGHIGLVEPQAFVLQQQSGGAPRPVDRPLPSVATKGAQAIVQPFILAPLGIGRGNAPRTVDQPMPTVLASRGGGHVVEPFIVQPTHGGGDSRRCTSIESPLPTQPCSNRFALAMPVIVQVNHGGGDSGRAQSVDAPVRALTTHNGHALVEPSIAKFYGDPERNVAGVREPLPTVTCKDRFALVEPVVGRIGIDIRFRMFKTHELARAMGFEEYRFTGTIEDQTRQIGNAVETNIAKALVKSLLGSL